MILYDMRDKHPAYDDNDQLKGIYLGKRYRRFRLGRFEIRIWKERMRFADEMIFQPLGHND